MVVLTGHGQALDRPGCLVGLGLRGRDTFLAAGGEKFARLECLNDSPESIAMLEQLIERELAGWLPHA